MEKIRVEVRFYGHLRQWAGRSRIQLEVSPELHRALEEIELQLGKPLSDLLQRGTPMMLNGRYIPVMAPREGRLKVGDVLAFMLPVIGG